MHLENTKFERDFSALYFLVMKSALSSSNGLHSASLNEINPSRHLAVEKLSLLKVSKNYFRLKWLS